MWWFILISLFILLAGSALLYGFCRLILNRIFGNRQDGSPAVKYFSASDFPGLSQTPVAFSSDKGQVLRGYWYYRPDAMDAPSSQRGIIIFAHGYGGGHLAYITEINTFASWGYTVLAYDNTGTFGSDGSSLRGFPQAIADLSAAYDFVATQNREHLPVFLCGHSWGAYAVCSFLSYKKTISGAVALSPFDSVSSMLMELLRQQTGHRWPILKPFFSLCLLLDFGKPATLRPSYALQESPYPVLLLHGDADTSVPLALSPLAYRSFFENLPGKQIQVYPGKGHNVYVTEAAERVMQQYFADYTALEGRLRDRLQKGDPLAAETLKEFTEQADFRGMTEEDPLVMERIRRFFEDCLSSGQ